MIRWIPYTFVRTVLFFIGGILLAFYDPRIIPEKIWWPLTLAMASTYMFLVFRRRAQGRFINPGWMALPLVFCLGYINLVRQTESRNPDHFLNYTGDVSFYKAIVTGFYEEKERSWKVEARLNEVFDDSWDATSGNLILYLSKEDFRQPFGYGDVLLIKGRPRETEGPGNPGEFDYKQYLGLRNIYHQHFLRKGEAIIVGHAPPSHFIAFAYRGRQWAEQTLSEFVKGPREQSIASALVLGVTDGLDNELLDAYSVTGSMHILAVSGLHISILYLILLWMLSPLNKIPRGKWAVAFISLTALWLYAFVTGLSPSVLRAVGMFSFFAIARPWAKSTNVYNTLAVSALCLLIFDPFLIRSVGFQLSYLAVLGIVYIYPRILRLWEPEHRITVELWKLSAVSIAAQIATFPLGLLYFHQFPNYFLLSNLIVVPLSFVVLVLGLIILAVALAPVVASILGAGLQMVIRFLNGVVFTIEEFPFSAITDVYISAWQCGLLIALIVSILCLCEYRKFKYIVVCCLCMFGISTLQWMHFFNDVSVLKVAIYKVPGHSAMDLIDCGSASFISDSALRIDQKKKRFHVIPHRQISGVVIESDRTADWFFRGGQLILWRGNTILKLTDKDFQIPGAMAVDLLVIGNNALTDLERIADKVTFRKVVLDSSNSFFFASRFLEATKLHKLDVHSVLHQGAFVTKIENKDS